MVSLGFRNILNNLMNQIVRFSIMYNVSIFIVTSLIKIHIIWKVSGRHVHVNNI